MEIYVNTKKKVHFIDKSIIRIKDVADIEAPQALKQEIERIELLQKTDRFHEAIKFNDIVKAIHKKHPKATIVNTGEKEVLVEWADKKKENKLVTFIKIAAVSIILFVGASTAIMTFHTDSQMGKVFEKYTELFLGESGNIAVIQVSYSIGLAVGIIAFFNHFGGKKLTNDPTPVQVEMSLYEKDVTETIVETISTPREKE
ncbi:MAG: stage V sporulation protein AA [Defluviitaleaceae bacterium]|nr:stage V sporulation protein AA [Defluviitaleaceae bacterium]